MLSQCCIDDILDLLTKAGADFGEVFAEESKNCDILAFQDRVESSSIGRDVGVGIRAFCGLNCFYAFVSGKKEEDIFQAAKEVAGACQNDRKRKQTARSWKQGGKIAETKRQHLVYQKALDYERLPYRVPGKEKLEQMHRAINAGMNYDKDIRKMSVKYLDREQAVQIANTEGLCAEDYRVKTRMMITAYAQNEHRVQQSYYGPGAMQGFEFYEKIDLEGLGREAARSAKTMLYAKPCPSGVMDVVVENGFGGLIFHEACGHSLEASSVAKGTSEFSGKMGQKVASDVLTLVDDGSIPGEWGSLGVDDEGVPVRKNVLIERGVLKGYMVDRLNARRMGCDPTGNGRRESYRFAPTSRMTNTYIMPGTDSKEDMIAKTQKGLFVKYINGGSVNPATGDFNFNTCETWLIENGKLTAPVYGCTLIGNGGRILQQVDMVGTDFDLRQGYCYAASGALFIGAGQPSVRVKGLTIGGIC